jgi:hypothetical protein
MARTIVAIVIIIICAMAYYALLALSFYAYFGSL